MATATDLYVGDVSPCAIPWTVSAHDLISDMTSVVSAVANIIYPGGATATWNLDIVSASASTLVVERQLIAGDLAFAGTYVSWLSLTTTIDTVVPTTQVSFVINAHG